jgi:hypothetical protein
VAHIWVTEGCEELTSFIKFLKCAIPTTFVGICVPREKKGRLEARRVPDIESLVDAVDRVHYIVILLLRS